MPGIYPTIIPGIYYFYANSNKNVLTATTIGGNGFTVRTWKNGYILYRIYPLNIFTLRLLLIKFRQFLIYNMNIPFQT